MAETADADRGEGDPRDDAGEGAETGPPAAAGSEDEAVAAHEDADEDGDDAEERSTAERLRELGSYIKEQRSRAQYSLRHLARVAGVSNPYLSQIERGLRKPSAEILQAIAKGLQISSETLYVKAGLLDEPSETPDLEEAILHEDSLTERQRAALIEVYRSFRIENERAEEDAADDADDGDEDTGDEQTDDEGTSDDPSAEAGAASGGPPADGPRSEAG